MTLQGRRSPASTTSTARSSAPPRPRCAPPGSTHHDLLAGDPLPELDAVDGIISFGGAQSVTEIDRYPYLLAEAEFLRRAAERDVPVLGVCLGAQLLAHALGGSVRRLPRRAVVVGRAARTPPRTR